MVATRADHDTCQESKAVRQALCQNGNRKAQVSKCHAEHQPQEAGSFLIISTSGQSTNQRVYAKGKLACV